MGEYIHRFVGYKTPIGLYFKLGGDTSSYSLSMRDRLFNGVAPVKVYSPWYLLKDQDSLVSVQLQKGEEVRLVGWELVDHSLQSDRIPLTLTLDDLYKEENDDYEFKYEGKFKSLGPLYKEIYERKPSRYEEEAFEMTIIGECDIENISSPIDMKIKMHNGYTSQKLTNDFDLSAIVNYTEIEKLLTPEFLIHERPCSLTSDQMYKIVRAYIKDNIDEYNAKITSDYDFCFAVSKVISVKPYNYKVEKFTPSGRSYSKPKFIEKIAESKRSPIFEMTNATDKYKGYTVISGLMANNLEQMAENLKSYLEALMVVINSPLKECEHCSGTGHLEVNLEV